MKFFGLQRGMGFERNNSFSDGIMTSFSLRDFTDCFITQNL